MSSLPATGSNRVRRRRAISVAILAPSAVAVLAFVAGAVWVARLPAQYTATATVIFSPKVVGGSVAAGSDSVVLTANNALGFIGASSTVTQAAAAAGMSASELSSATSATVLASTATLQIDVTNGSAQAAADAANAYADELLTEMESNSVVAAQKVGSVEVPSAPSGPARTILTAVVAALAVLIGLMVLSLIVWISRIRSRGGPSAILGGWMDPGGQSRDEAT